MAKSKTNEKVEFGDFQTPRGLASGVCRLLADRGLRPASVIEPTCGQGNLLAAAIAVFPSIEQAVGFDINSKYVEAARRQVRECYLPPVSRIEQGDFFKLDWAEVVRNLPHPVLVLGNPPWVTNAHLTVLGSTNLPAKSNFQGRTGLDALTGKSNFDISEWMLIHLLEWLKGSEATMAMLCKTTVARKTLLHAWKNDWDLSEAYVCRIDASEHFGAAVEASLLVASTSTASGGKTAAVYKNLWAKVPSSVMAFCDRTLLADLTAYDRWRHLRAGIATKWRSGVKHDCSRVMELRKEGAMFRNGMGELVDLEYTYLFPLYKSSDVARGGAKTADRWVLVPQRRIGDDTSSIEQLAPKTWDYLQSHAELLGRRGSSIYKGQPPFSVFGVGAYSYALWKVAISGFYKRLKFTVVGPVSDKPIMLDDTCYFLPCDSRQEAETAASILNSRVASEFFAAFIFWDAKRPITADLLRRLSLAALAKELGVESEVLGRWATEDSRITPESLNRNDPAATQGVLW